jgi:hypothetical protein
MRLYAEHGEGTNCLRDATNLLRDFDNFRYALIHSRFTQETDFH